MTPKLKILAAGPGCTVQDEGRHGLLRYGVTGAGPMDPFAHAVANRALGNPRGAAAIEVSLGGLELTAENDPITVALAGGAFAISLDGQDLPPAVVVTVQPESTLKIRGGPGGAWCYLAVPGGLDVPLMLGSASTHTRTGIGGIDGRALRAGDRIAAPASGRPVVAAGRIDVPALDRPADTIRVIMGPQADSFSADQIERFLAGPWTVSTRGDRMACFLQGPTLTHARGYNIVSDGIAMGAIQVPGEGQPIVLMADRQSTGGYPKIATIIGADLGRLAQARPGTSFRFRRVEHAEAVDARQAEHDLLAGPIAVEPVIRTTFPSEFLLGLNLIDGCVDGLADA
ncbi:biotin-dependent carboxyltransferase family protein [Methylobacterium terricola]|uniref:Biotin-dependent carboxyltransferase family protein n=1 Tax=Methylobacterium terricola TaxID=2583531 RepID=A0A5C4LJS4_9HYPH|nr:biotin-dependent carboxyltransferase family protein [Methylobacterium terricola]TNC14481.1 biotin-dependent carboxyltransferase family protein [Methylobacterium terricola]